MKKSINFEIEKRIVDENTAYAVVGPELRLRRLSLNKTLKYVSYKICSVSYVCRVENNYIRPNAMYLREMSKRLDMDEKNVTMLLSLRDSLDIGIKSILFNDFKKIKEIIDNSDKFLNYRYKLLIFLYETNANHIEIAKDYYEELNKISRSMTDYDFKIFVIVTAIYFFKSGSLKDSYNILQGLEKMDRSNNMTGVINLYMFYDCAGLGRPEAIYYYNLTKEFLYSIGSYELLDYVNYQLAIFYIKNKSYEFALKLTNMIKDQKYKNSINLLVNYMKDKSIKAYNPKNLVSIAKCIYTYKYNDKAFDEAYEMMNKTTYQLDFSSLIFEYEFKNNSMDKYDFILENISKNYLIKEDFFLKRYFLGKMASISKDSFKYKTFTDMYEELNREE